MFQWFSKKPAPKTTLPLESSGLGHVDATVPLGARGGAKTNTPGSAANRKTERLERRELLYSVVRESMTRAGVLSASYKFKVLSLDSRGRQYLIMMDLARQYAGETGRLAEIEALIAQAAKGRHDILVTAVYWRVNEHVTAGLSDAHPSPTAGQQGAAPVPAAKIPPFADSSRPRFEPLQADEVVAFKQALASAPVPPPTAAVGELVHSGRRNPSPYPTFADTELDERQSPLSGTQYGELN
jgi:hypothetical protein